jgi:type I restriction enzyme, S subunit
VSWPSVKLGNVCKLVNGDRGKNYPSKDALLSEGIPFINAGNLTEDNSIICSGANFISEERYDLLSNGKVRCGDVLFCLRGSLGKFSVVDSSISKGAVASSLVIIRPNNELDESYLKNYLRSTLCKREVSRFENGAAQPNLSAKDLREFKIPLPPLPEQKRIAAILDKADAIRRKRQQAIQLADEFLRAVFLDMFGDPVTNPKGWDEKKWQDVLVIINGKNQKKVESLTGKYPIYGSGGKMGLADDYLCNENTVIIGRKGNINKPILVKDKFWNVDTAFGLVVKPDKISFYYLYWFCLFFDFEKLNKTVTIPSLTKSDLLEISLPLPPLKDQNKFAEICEKVSRLLVKSHNSLELSSSNFSSISQKAFSGQL